MTPTPESQQAALKPVGYVCANNGSGGLQVCDKDTPGAMPIYASDLERATPVSESHATLVDANDEDIQFLHKWAEMCGSTQQAMRLNGIISRLSALRAHPAGGVSELIDRMYDEYGKHFDPDDCKKVWAKWLQAAGLSGVPAPFAAVFYELQRATVKFPTWPTDPLHALAVLGEEFGELDKAIMETVYEAPKSTPEDVNKEAIQTAAMALRFVLSLNTYRYVPCEQHHQPPVGG